MLIFEGVLVELGNDVAGILFVSRSIFLHLYINLHILCLDCTCVRRKRVSHRDPQFHLCDPLFEGKWFDAKQIRSMYRYLRCCTSNEHYLIARFMLDLKTFGRDITYRLPMMHTNGLPVSINKLRLRCNFELTTTLRRVCLLLFNVVHQKGQDIEASKDACLV